MPGAHAVLCDNDTAWKGFDTALADQASDIIISVEEVFQSNDCRLAFSGHAGYPRRCFETDRFTILLEGAIYNTPPDVVDKSLGTIADKLIKKLQYDVEVRDFIEAADGDFIAIIYNKIGSDLLIFNDRWARLPAYFYFSRSLFAFSRTISFLLHWLPSIRFNTMAMAEFLMMNYVLGSKTLIENVTRLDPASLVHVCMENGLSCRVVTLIQTVFGSSAEVMEREAIERCATLFIQALEHRARFFEKWGPRITADLTGGRDSRAIFVGMNRLNADAEFYSDDLNTSNEFSYVKALEEQYGRKVTRVALVEPPVDLSAMRQLTYLTDCTVNGWTSSLVEYKTLERRKLVNGPAVRFMGFGGEFIRTIYQVPYLYSDFSELVRDDIYFTVFNKVEAAGLLGMDVQELTDQLVAYFNGYPEKILEDKLKHLYFEYYNVEVNAGENRQRRHFWTVEPLWAKDLVLYEMSVIPTRMCTRSFFDRFLRRIDPRATDTVFFRRNIDERSWVSVAKYHLENRFRKMIQGRFFLKNTRLFRKRIRGENRLSPTRSLIDEEITTLLANNRVLRQVFDSDAVRHVVERRVNSTAKFTLLTLLLYIDEIDRRHLRKIEI